MHELIEKLTEMLNLTPEQQFRVSAMIKRNIHDEKASVFHRYSMYMQGPPIFDRTDPENPKVIGHEPSLNPWLHSIMVDKAEQHAEWAKMPDEEVITWSVGSFKYVQKRDPCSVCGVDLTGKPYAATYDKTGHKTFCATHAPKDENEEG
jgi:hypothetical protein